MYHHVIVILQSRPGEQALPSTVWGPTCDSDDKVCETDLPELAVGDWLYFDNTGAYSRSLSTKYNGFDLPICYYYLKHSDW